MEATSETGLSGTGGVIHFHGKAAPPPIQPKCPSTHRFKLQREELTNQIFCRHIEYIEMEKENNLLSQKVEALDGLVKQHDHEVACLKYSMEKIRMEKKKLETCLKDNEEKSRMAAQPEVAYIPPEADSNVGQAEKTSILNTPLKLKHEADLQKEPKIFCVCGVQFTTKQNLREHIKYYTFGMNFSCPTCGIRKHGLNQLRTHMRVTHNVSSSHLASVKGCRLCGRLFTSLAQLHEHRRNEHGTVRL